MNQKPYGSGGERRSPIVRQLHISFEAFAGDLRRRGYQEKTIGRYGRVVGHFGQWLARQGVGPRQIRLPQVSAFLKRHLPQCHCPSPVIRCSPLCRGALNRFLDFLRRERWIADQPERAVRPTAADRLVLEFDQHMDQVQGLSEVTRRARRRYAREWLEWQFGGHRLEWSALQPRDLFGFVTAQARHLKGTSVHALAVGLRGFLRFLEFTGRIRMGLAAAVPSPACPALLPPAQVLDAQSQVRFLRSFDRRTAAGRRDYAIALCFSDLALRANEVVALTLDDLDWHALTLRLRQTKQRRERLLPLPARVARALVAYLRRDRPAAAHRFLFINYRPPLGRPLSSNGVRHVIRRAFGRCGLPANGPHILRQSWATQAHQRGTDLKRIADVLGHRSVETTVTYAKVHVEELRQAALPWPRRRP